MRFLKSDSDKVKILQQWCRNYQKASETKDRSWQRLEAEGKWLAWKDVLEVLKRQKEIYESSGGCIATRAQESQKYTVLLLYTSIPPARSKEYRELRVAFTPRNLGRLFHAFPLQASKQATNQPTNQARVVYERLFLSICMHI